MTTEKESYMMELWVSRAAVETVMRAAMTLRSEIDNAGSPTSVAIENAVKAVQEAVIDAWEDSLNITPF